MTKAQANLLKLFDIPAEELSNPIALIKRIGVIEARFRDMQTTKNISARKRTPKKPKPTPKQKAKSSGKKLITRMRATREQYGLSRKEFAQFCGCHVQTLYAWESGRSAPTEDSQESIRQAIRAVEKNRLTVKEQEKVAASPAGASH